MLGDNFKYQNLEESPASLYDITLKYIAENIHILYESYGSDVRVRRDFRLPGEICER